jgi:hypothetical protein
MHYHIRTFHSTIIQFKQKNPAPQRGSVVKDFVCGSKGHRFNHAIRTRPIISGNLLVGTSREGLE